jgi:undecaprenyl-diphosphatase
MNQIIHSIQLWDERTILRMIALRGLSLTRFMKTVSVMGDGYLWAVLAMMFFAFTGVSPEWLLTGLTAFTVELVFYKIIKQSTTRQRPFRAHPGIVNLVVPQDEYSFPSGHTAAATVAAFLFSIALPVLTPLFFLFAVLIGISRIYLGVHYPSDVLMGFTLGVASFSLAAFIF